MSIRAGTPWGVAVAALLAVACTSEVPRNTPSGSIPPSAAASARAPLPTAGPPSPSLAPTMATTSPAAASPSPEVPTATRTSSQEPTSSPVPSRSPGPPYRLTNLRGQDPHTILFGDLLVDGFYYLGNVFDQDRPLAFAAYFGQPAHSQRLTFTLYRIEGVRHSVVWSVTKPVSKDATGFADTLANVQALGVYGLGVTRGFNLLAWGSFVIVPPSGG